jgi:hypothetical protein
MTKAKKLTLEEQVKLDQENANKFNQLLGEASKLTGFGLDIEQRIVIKKIQK